MKMNSMKNKLSLILCIVLIAAMALFAAGCNDTAPDPSENPATGSTDPVETGGDMTVLGEGETVFYFIAVDLEGVETKYEIHTNETIVGAALLDLELIAGDVAEYGLYVKTVNGITLDWDTHGKYWALYIDGEYSMSGVDSVDITAGATYTFQPA